MDITKRENFRAWLQWLRDNPNRQAQKALAVVQTDKTVNYCCLGVACKLSGEGEWDERGGVTTRAYMTNGYRSSNYMPGQVAQWLGFDGYIENPDVHRVGSLTTAASMNDAGYTFADIAHALEAEYGGDENWQ